MARKDQDRKPVEIDDRKERREINFFREMEEDMVFGGRGDRDRKEVDLRSWSSPSDDDDRREW